MEAGEQANANLAAMQSKHVEAQNNEASAVGDVVTLRKQLADAEAQAHADLAVMRNKLAEAQKSEASAREEVATTYKQLSDTQQQLVDANEKANTMQKMEASARKQLAEAELSQEMMNMMVFGEGGFEGQRKEMKKVLELKHFGYFASED